MSSLRRKAPEAANQRVLFDIDPGNGHACLLQRLLPGFRLALVRWIWLREQHADQGNNAECPTQKRQQPFAPRRWSFALRDFESRQKQAGLCPQSRGESANSAPDSPRPRRSRLGLGRFGPGCSGCYPGLLVLWRQKGPIRRASRALSRKPRRSWHIPCVFKAHHGGGGAALCTISSVRVLALAHLLSLATVRRLEAVLQAETPPDNIEPLDPI